MFGYNPAPKPQFKRYKPTAKQRGSISPSVREALHKRSRGICERDGCTNKAVHAAHRTRRWKIEGKTTVNDLLHLCLTCHIWADTTEQGREFLASKQVSQ